MKRWIWIALTVVVGPILVGAVVVLIAGSMMGPHRDITVQAHFRTAPQALYATLADFPTWPSWYAPAKTVERIREQDGHPVWRLEMGWGPLEDAVVEQRAPSESQSGKLRTEMVDPKSPVQGGWEFTLTPANGGTDLVLTDHGKIENPVMRFMMWRLVGPSATIVPAVEGLAKKYGETVTPVVSQTEVP